jgi:hypothetical protein
MIAVIVAGATFAAHDCSNAAKTVASKGIQRTFSESPVSLVHISDTTDNTLSACGIPRCDERLIVFFAGAEPERA